MQAPIHSLFLLIKTRKGYPLEKSFYFIEKKLTKVKWETPKERPRRSYEREFRERLQFSIQFTGSLWSSNKTTEAEYGLIALGIHIVRIKKIFRPNGWFFLFSRWPGNKILIFWPNGCQRVLESAKAIFFFFLIYVLHNFTFTTETRSLSSNGILNKRKIKFVEKKKRQIKSNWLSKIH